MSVLLFPFNLVPSDGNPLLKSRLPEHELKVLRLVDGEEATRENHSPNSRRCTLR